VSAVILLRRTDSTRVYVQQVGRGLRKAPSKKDCVVLDFGGNEALHGSVMHNMNWSYGKTPRDSTSSNKRSITRKMNFNSVSSFKIRAYFLFA
jgi:superfamily II DNA or RNA helicase